MLSVLLVVSVSNAMLCSCLLPTATGSVASSVTRQTLGTTPSPFFCNHALKTTCRTQNVEPRRYSPHPHPLLQDAVPTGKGCTRWAAMLGSRPAVACWRDASAGPGALAGMGLEMSWAAAVTVAGFGALPARYGRCHPPVIRVLGVLHAMCCQTMSCGRHMSMSMRCLLCGYANCQRGRVRHVATRLQRPPLRAVATC